MGVITNNNYASFAVITTDQAGEILMIDPNDIALLKTLVTQLQTDFAAIKPKTGNLRIQDSDDINDSDYVEFEVDDGTGIVKIKVPVGNITELTDRFKALNFPQVANLNEHFEFIEIENEVNVNATPAYDATAHEIIIDVDNTGVGAGSCDVYFQFVIPSDFKEFEGGVGNDDIIIRAIQDAGATINCTMNVEFYEGGAAIDRSNYGAARPLTGSYANYGCDITGGTYNPGDRVRVKATLSLPDTDDALMLNIPLIPYLRS